jgi:type III secretion system TyeA family effector delivery regulator
MAEVKKVQKSGSRSGQLVAPMQGAYRGQPVAIIHDTQPSAIQLANNIAGFTATRQKLREPILRRHIVSKKVFREKEKVLAAYTERLGQTQQTRQYKEVYADLARQQYKPEYREENNQDALRDLLLYKVAENFGEVTEQDNVLEYAIATHRIDRETLEVEIAQVKKMLEFFSNPPTNTINIGFANSERIKWNEKLATLEDSLKASDVFQIQLLRAKELLQKTHEQEIRDGYNLIPKAAAILSQQTGDSGAAQGAINLAVTYRDEVLVMMNPLDIFETFIHRQEKKRESFRPYVDSMIALFGIDMASSNPSRSQEELRNVRNGLFRIEICGQIYDSIGTLGGEIRRIFFETKKEMSDKEQLAATRELVKLSQGAFVSSQQVTNFMDLLCSTGAKHLEIAIYMLHQMIELVRNLPEKFFKDSQSQAQFLGVMQTKLDALILQEEEAAAATFLKKGDT